MSTSGLKRFDNIVHCIFVAKQIFLHGKYIKKPLGCEYVIATYSAPCLKTKFLFYVGPLFENVATHKHFHMCSRPSLILRTSCCVNMIVLNINEKIGPFVYKTYQHGRIGGTIITC